MTKEEEWHAMIIVRKSQARGGFNYRSCVECGPVILTATLVVTKYLYREKKSNRLEYMM